MAITLPTTKLPAITQDPKNLIIYGTPKVGKTTLLSTLKDNLILDFEDGSDYVEALKLKVNNFKEFNEICEAIVAAGKPYKFITVDTVTALEDFAKPLAMKLYKATPAGANYSGDILLAPNGSGYGYLRNALDTIISKLQSLAPNLILVGHVKDKSIISAAGTEVGNMKDFDLTGKNGRILAAKSDAIGYIYRDKNSNLCINFETKGEVTAGARPVHLANQNIVVAERQEDGSFVSYWERIYPSLAQ